MPKSQRSDCSACYFFENNQCAPLLFFSYCPHIKVTGGLGNAFPRIPCHQVSALELTKQRPQRLKEVETIIFCPVRRLLGLHQKWIFVASSAPW